MSSDPTDPPVSAPQEPVDPEVIPRATRRKFSAKDKLSHLDAVAALQGTGQIGEYLRENGLYHSQLSTWRQLFDEGGLEALEPKARGPKPLSQDELEHREQARELERLRKHNQALEKKLAQAQAIIEVQKKLATLMGTLEDSKTFKSDS